MSTPTYTISSTEDDLGKELATITVIFSDGSTRATNSTNGNYKAVVKAVAIDEADEDEVRDLLTPALGVGKALRALSERVLFDNNTIYFDGDPLDSSLANHIVEILNEGAAEVKWRALVNFMEKLYSNPSQKSIDSLYEFLRRQGITILPNGDFLAYKGLKADGTSIHAGYGIVDGVVFEDANLQNNIGSVIEIPRSKVNANTAVGCATGLHAGSYAYASGFAQGMLVTVQVNPRDVVSVPDDCHFQKIRTARYTVLSQTEVAYTQTTYRDADNDWAEDDSYDDDEDSEYYNDERDELIEELENWRDDNDERDFEAQPLDQDEADLLNDASDYTSLDDEEDAALSAFYKKSLDSGVQSGKNFFNSLAHGLKDGSIGGPADEVNAKTAEALKDADVSGLTVIGFSNTTSAPAPAAAPATHSVVGISKPSVSEFAKQLQAEIDSEEDIALSFDYTRGDGSETTVEKFTPTDIEARGTDLLVTGSNAEGQWRSYYYGRMENISVRDADTKPKHAS